MPCPGWRDRGRLDVMNVNLVVVMDGEEEVIGEVVLIGELMVEEVRGEDIGSEVTMPSSLRSGWCFRIGTRSVDLFINNTL